MQRRTLFRAALAAIAAPALAAAAPRPGPLAEVHEAMVAAWNSRPTIVPGHSHAVTDPGHSHALYVSDPGHSHPINAAARCWDTCYAGAPLTWYPT